MTSMQNGIDRDPWNLPSLSRAEQAEVLLSAASAAKIVWIRGGNNNAG
jgi:hypothetical protein